MKIKNKLKYLSSHASVRFQHCDPLGHLNNSIYIDYFLNAREDQLWENYGFDNFEYAKEGNCAWVIANHKINYLIPVKAKQNLLIESHVAAFDHKSITVHFSMKSNDKLMANMVTTFVHIDLKTSRPTQHTEEWLTLLDEILVTE